MAHGSLEPLPALGMVISVACAGSSKVLSGTLSEYELAVISVVACGAFIWM